MRDLTDEHLRVRPHPGLSSLAWLLWHMTRAEDVGINLVIAQHPQVLDKDGWATQLNMSLRDIATGMTDQEVEEFSQQVNIMSRLACYTVVEQQTRIFAACSASAPFKAGQAGYHRLASDGTASCSENIPPNDI